MSIAGVWEIQLKIQVGKLKLDVSLSEAVEIVAQQNDLKILPVNLDHIYDLNNLPFHHKDPFDRLIIAQAIVEDFTIVTDDPQFPAYPVKIL